MRPRLPSPAAAPASHFIPKAGAAAAGMSRAARSRCKGCNGARRRHALAGGALSYRLKPGAAGLSRAPGIAGSRWTFDKACSLLLVFAGGKSSHPAALWGHAAEDCNAGGASGITGERAASKSSDAQTGNAAVSLEIGCGQAGSSSQPAATIELPAARANRGLGDDKTFQNLPYGTDLS